MGLPLYYRISEDIIKSIKEGKFLPGQKLPSLKDIMKKYNVSDITARKSINQLAEKNFIYKIQGKGYFLKADNEKYLCKSSSRTIVFIATDTMYEFYNGILTGILDIVQKNGYFLEIANSNTRYANEKKVLRKYFDRDLAGIIFVPSSYTKSYRHLFELYKKGVSVVLIDRELKGYNFNFVSSDHKKGAEEATEYLIESGHKDIVFLGGYKSTIIKRFEGYKNALKKHNIKLNPELVLLHERSTGNHNGSDYEIYMKQGYERMKLFLKRKIKFTAILALNDIVAIGAYHALREKRLKIPDDISLVGFDDLKIAENFIVPLTTVRQDTYHIGYYCGKIITEQNYKERKKILVKTELVVRKSTRKIN